MRILDVKTVEDAVCELFIKANSMLPCDLERALECARDSEDEPLVKKALEVITDNLGEAKKYDLPICQDTGMAIVMIELGNEIHINGDLEKAVNDGVKRAYVGGKLRLSVVSDPLFDRKNTESNTPAIIYTKIVSGDKIKITALPKGFGSENKSAVKMFNPSATPDDIVDFVTETVERAGSMPCPPLVVGVGIGGSFDYAAFLSKKALCRDTAKSNENEYYAALEKRLLKDINRLGIGPQGFGGKTTALAVNIEYAPTHIAGLPVAVNIGCHVTRHKSKEI